MKEIHGFADFSFNSEVVSISISDFAEFYTNVFPDDAERLKDAVDAALKESKGEARLPTSACDARGPKVSIHEGVSRIGHNSQLCKYGS